MVLRSYLGSAMHPLERVPLSQQKKTLALLLLFTLLVMLAMGLIDRELKTVFCPYGIISFEFVWSAARAAEVIDHWSEAARIAAGFSLGLDYLFLPLYSTTLVAFLLFGAPQARWSRWLAWGQWLAALLDAIENLCLLLLLTREVNDGLAHTATICASVKFLLVVLGLLGVLFSRLIQRR